MVRPRYPLIFWLEMLGIPLTALNAWLCFINFRDAHMGFAALAGTAAIMGAWGTRRPLDYLLCNFCVWYLARKAKRVFEMHKDKIQLVINRKDVDE